MDLPSTDAPSGPSGLSGLALAIGTHASLSYIIGLSVVMCATIAAWLWSRRDAPTRLGKRFGKRFGFEYGVGFAVILGAAAVFGMIALHLGQGGSISGADELLAATLGAHLSHGALTVFAWLTHPGDTIVLTSVGVAVSIALLLARQRLLAAAWIMAVGGNSLLNPLLKTIFERARPLHDHGLTTDSGWSFPSGHSSGSMVAYGMLCYLALRLSPPRWHLPALLGAAAIVFTTGFSRVALQVHFASDVMAGFASGVAWLVVCILVLRAAEAQSTMHSSASS